MFTWLLKLFKSEDIIPVGQYCYGRKGGKVVDCPYWSKRKDKPPQWNGYCGYLKQGDWEDKGLGILWDKCKECGIKVDYFGMD